MKIKNILIGCDDLIIVAIQSLVLTDKLYENSFPIMSGARVRFDREKLDESQAFYKLRSMKTPMLLLGDEMRYAEILSLYLDIYLNNAENFQI